MRTTIRIRYRVSEQFQGGTGTLVFVDIAPDTHHEARLLVSELQSVVYRAAAPSGAHPFE